MSVFNLEAKKIEFTDEWFTKNINNGTPECLAQWSLNSNVDLLNRLGTDYYGTYVLLKTGESLTIPFECKEIDLLETKRLLVNYRYLGGPSNGGIHIDYNNGVDDIIYYTSAGYKTSYSEIPNNTNDITIAFNGDAATTMYIYISTNVELKTKDLSIKTELNQVSMNLNMKTSVSVGNTLHSSKVKETEVFYSNPLIIKHLEEKQMNQLVDNARLNKRITLVNINTVEEAGNSVANIASGGLDNWIVYFYNIHTSTQKSGIYSYVNLKYKKDNNSNSYI